MYGAGGRLATLGFVCRVVFQLAGRRVEVVSVIRASPLLGLVSALYTANIPSRWETIGPLEDGIVVDRRLDLEHIEVDQSHALDQPKIWPVLTKDHTRQRGRISLRQGRVAQLADLKQRVRRESRRI